MARSCAHSEDTLKGTLKGFCARRRAAGTLAGTLTAAPPHSNEHDGVRYQHAGHNMIPAKKARGRQVRNAKAAAVCQFRRRSAVSTLPRADVVLPWAVLRDPTADAPKGSVTSCSLCRRPGCCACSHSRRAPAWLHVTVLCVVFLCACTHNSVVAALPV